MRTPEETRQTVSDAYRRAVETPAKKNAAACCGPTCCDGAAGAAGPEPKGVAVQSAGYRRDDLEGLPADAVENSFGCGNPLAFSDIFPGQTVLDLGSGAGIDLLIAARRVGPSGRVIGVDMTDAMVERARANVAAAGLDNVDVRKGCIEDLPVDAGSVDWVISNCVINLSPEKDRVFEEIARVLKPGGRVSVSDIVLEGELPDSLRANERIYSSCIGGAISEPAYLAGLREAGLVHVEVADRHVYDPAQLERIIASELPEDDGDGDGGACCCGIALAPDEAKALATAAAGKVWSARVTARKPM